jgi:hypothetical protein
VRVEDGSIGVLGWQDINKFDHFMKFAKLRDGCSIVYAYESASRPQPARGDGRSIRIECRPLLVSGMLTNDDTGRLTILIDSEQSESEKRAALWHEIAHVVRVFENGSQDETEIEALGRRLATAWTTRGEVSEIGVEIHRLASIVLSDCGLSVCSNASSNASTSLPAASRSPRAARFRRRRSMRHSTR